MAELRATIARVAPHRSTVLIRGESGTGKELVARAIHDASGRTGGFVAVNCGAIPAPLLESELFGHKRGAFTDAVRDRAGLFEDADGGTLFLDEVGELPLPLQVKLLRAIQESEIRKVGDTATIRVDVRVVAATLRDLEAEVKAGRFREDLYYRLDVLQVMIAPLRHRAEDVPALVEAFASRHPDAASRFTSAAIELLQRATWPGNVRELENTIERAAVMARGELITPADLRLPEGEAEPTFDPELPLKEVEQRHVQRALAHHEGNVSATARALGVSRRWLHYRLKEWEEGG
jgi:Nif-specific regulatory protein